MSQSRAWLLTAIITLTTVVFGAGLFKVAGTMVFIIDEFAISMTAAGMLMSANGITATLIALPGGGIMQKIGARAIVLIALVVYIIGNVAGALTNSYNALLITRFIEGIGFGLIGLAAPPLINALFPPEKRGLPMGIWSLFVSFGSLFILNIANVITPNFGWRGNWWLVTGLCALFLVIFALTVKEPEQESAPPPAQGEGPKPPQEEPSLGKVLMTPGPWCLAIGFFTFAIGSGAMLTFYPTYLQEVFAMESAQANSITAITSIAMIASGILTGFVLNKIPNRNHSIFYFVMCILYTIVSVIQFNLPSVGVVIPFVIIYGLIAQAVPPTILSLVPEAAATPAMLPIAMGVLMFGQNLGGILTNIIVGQCVDLFGTWGSIAIPLAICCGGALIAAGALIPIMRKKYATMTQN